MKFFATRYAFTIAIPNAVARVTLRIPSRGPVTLIVNSTIRMPHTLK